ncbi:related to N-acetyltransferase [Ustilago sp. UG-2017b]|nr:related to N-acetyltransferase [Ustilago sp. UG-2017b]
MRTNRSTILAGRKVVLVPYRKQHVPRYHEWMKDPLIQEQTASEPLSLEEEYEMQQSWAVDEDKLTFIILALPEMTSSKGEASSIEVCKAQDLVSKSKMVGDVNIFFNARHEDEEDEEVDKTEGNGAKQRSNAECEIMIAEHSYRRQGIAREALQMMFAFVTTRPTPVAQASSDTGQSNAAELAKSNDAIHCTLPIPLDWLTCKISLSNTPSIQLFESLGFTRQSVSEIWKEVELRFTSIDSKLHDQIANSIQNVLYLSDE